MTPDEVDRLRLAFCGLHPDRSARLVREMGAPGAVLAAIRGGKVRVPAAAAWAAAAAGAECHGRLTRLGVRPVFRHGEGYPAWLAELPNAPDVLLVKGSLPSLPGVAIVGTRRCTRYGLALAREYGRACAEAGWPVVSGLARGADAEAHRGVAEAGGIGCAVMGCGPDIVYPPEHRPLLAALLAAGGGAATEYPPGTPPEAWRFPPRNRIISGLAAAVVVVEAGVRGGALITAAAALEQGRHVFAVPGDVGRATSEGCNLLIRDGATPVLRAPDLVASLSLLLSLPRPSARAPTAEGLEPAARALLAALPPGGLPIEEAARAAGLPAPAALALLSRLEVAGRLSRRGGIVVPGR